MSDVTETATPDDALPRIVVGVDGSAASLDALDWAIREAVLRGCQLDVVQTWWSPYPLGGPEVTVVDRTSHQDATESMVASAVEAAVRRVGAAPDTVREIAVEDTAAKGLLRYARGAEMLVLGTRGHGGFTGLLIGSVTHQCTHHATCPVVVVPHRS